MWLMMTSSTVSGSTPNRFSASPTGVMTVRPRLVPTGWSKPVSTTKVRLSFLITQTK